MPRTVKLLLTENVDNTGIVGDVVNVRKGFARNFLLPRGYATQPSDEMIKSLQAKREAALASLAALRKEREAIIAKLTGFNLEMIRSCNDMGILYGAVTQHELATALGSAGFPGIRDREVRLGQPIKRVGDYHLTVKFESDLEADVTLHVKPDRELPQMRADAEAAAAAAAAAAAGGAEGEPVMEKRQKDKSAKFETAKPGQKKDEEGAGEAKAKVKKEEKSADAKPAKKGSDEAKRQSKK